MRRTFTLAAAVLATTSLAVTALAASRPPTADSIITAAEKSAKREHKNVLVLFHATWWGWCKRLDSLFELPDFHKAVSGNYVVVHVDVMESDANKKATVENPGGMALMQSFGGEKSGLPFYVFLGPDGKKLADSNTMPGGQNIGYPGSLEEAKAFGKLLEQTAPHLAVADREQLVQWLSTHKPVTASPGAH